jgi:hypothetical protein
MKSPKITILFIAALVFCAACNKKANNPTETPVEHKNPTGWIQISNGLTNMYITSLVASDTNLFAGTWNNDRDLGGIFLLTVNDTSWRQVFIGTDVNALVALEKNIYAGTSNGVFVLTDNGNHWSAFPNTQVNALAVLGTDIIAGTFNQGIYLSSNQGGSWAAINSGLPGNYMITALAVSGSSIFAGFSGAGIYRSTDHGASWTQLNPAWPIYYAPSAFAVSGDMIFAQDAYADHIILSTDNGTNWAVVDSGLPNNATYVRAFAVLGENLFAGAQGGIFLSTSNGTNWIDVSSGLPSGIEVSSFAIMDSILYAGSLDYGVWRRPLNEMINNIADQ